MFPCLSFGVVRANFSGVVIGIGAAFVLSRALTAFLFEVEPTDPVMLGSAGVLFAAIGLMACWMPTRRATDVDPRSAPLRVSERA